MPEEKIQKKEDDIEVKFKKQTAKPLYLNKTKTLVERQAHYTEVINKKMNPIPKDKFNPDTFEPLGDVDDMVAIANRKRSIPPEVLPTCGLNPKVFREGQMIGMFESKQDSYLTMAHCINRLTKQVRELEEKVNNN